MPSPQYEVSVQCMPGVGHVQPGSIVHIAEQPSPLVVLPSSHCSSGSRCASPHIGTGTIVQAPPLDGQVQPLVTCEQSLAQPAVPVVEPSSHASLPSTMPSPQMIVE